jgi:ABC-type transport system substrate-binding protein
MSSLSRRNILILAAYACSASVSSSIAVAQQATSASGPRIALDGYDPISYFDPGRPEKGSPEFSFAFDDAVYWFKSADHRAKFVADPERYAPQYGGYCAITMSGGEKGRADPEAWSISDGKLYVFRMKKGVEKFNGSPAEIAALANANWQKLHESK